MINKLDLLATTSVSKNENEREDQKRKRNKKNKRRSFELSETSSEDELDFMGNFFCDLNKIKKDLKKMKQNMNHLKGIHHGSLSNTSQESLNKHTNLIKENFDLIKTNSLEIKKSIELLEKKTQKLINQENNQNVCQSRIRVNNIASVKNKFLKLFQEFLALESSLRDDLTNNIVRQCKIVDPNLDEEEIEKVIENSNVNKFNAFSPLQTRKSQRILEEISKQYSNILFLEKSISELSSMFSDFSFLVHLQSEKIDSIENNIVNSKKNIQDTNKILKESRGLQKKVRKKKYYILSLSALVGLGITLTGLSKVFKKK
ncbi:syntaxin-1a [Anaeramoeba flamelloides]|uniref:Syntaxin-1a n=1 Tax=Anaeramoeba flamelloides TaxID=1746091 RepID=A0ABQ8Y4C1_9EUKA|nr:syntaxin-1a [Anaeramoeba flamelloides]